MSPKEKIVQGVDRDTPNIDTRRQRSGGDHPKIRGDAGSARQRIDKRKREKGTNQRAIGTRSGQGLIERARDSSGDEERAQKLRAPKRGGLAPNRRSPPHFLFLACFSCVSVALPVV